MKRKFNYFVTSIAYYERKVLTQRTFGYFEHLKDAKRAVKENRCNMVECLYNYLVIEKIPANCIHPVTDPEKNGYEYWYYAEANTWVECYKPSFSKGLCNWALG